MQTNKAIFIIGSPGSGKDIIIKDICSNYNMVEFTSSQIDEMLSDDLAFKRAKSEKRNSLLETQSILVTANSYDLGFVITKQILEFVGYETYLIMVEADLTTSYNRLNNRKNLKESLERVNIGNFNRNSIISLFSDSIVVDNSTTLDLSESRKFIFDILEDLTFNSDLTLEEITTKSCLKKKLKSVVPGRDAVVIPILAHYDINSELSEILDATKTKKRKSITPGASTDATGEQITGWTSHMEAMDEPFPYYSPMTSGGRLSKVSSPNTTVDLRSDQDKEETKKVLGKVKNIIFKQSIPKSIW